MTRPALACLRSLFACRRGPLAGRSAARRAAAAALAALVLWPAVAVAQDTDTGDGDGTDADQGAASESGAEGEAAAERVLCQDAPAVFELLCQGFKVLDEDYVDELADEDLARAAADGVREAGLDPRGTEAAPACALPSPAFEQACIEIDAVEDTAEAVWAAASAMFASVGDPNTFLMSPSEYEQIQERLDSGVPYSGIGLRLGLLDGTVGCDRLSETCRLTVSEVFPGSPAERAGLKADDILLSLAGLVPSGSGCGLEGLPTFEPGSLVAAVVERDGRRRSFRLEAEPVYAPTVAGRTVAGSTGYLRLGSFGARTDVRFAEELEALLDSGVETIVVDLRGNRGGYLQTVIDIASMFLNDRQVVIRETSRTDSARHLVNRDSGPAAPVLLPVALAVDGTSASASEVMTLALRHHGRATVVGTTTYGKNTGQITPGDGVAVRHPARRRPGDGVQVVRPWRRQRRRRHRAPRGGGPLGLLARYRGRPPGGRRGGTARRPSRRPPDGRRDRSMRWPRWPRRASSTAPGAHPASSVPARRSRGG